MPSSSDSAKQSYFGKPALGGRGLCRTPDLSSPDLIVRARGEVMSRRAFRPALIGHVRPLIVNLSHIEEVSLHEFGHALGLLHEHQSPESKCENEFDWPRVHSYAKRNWGWDEATVKDNFSPYISDPRLRTTPYDRNSIITIPCRNGCSNGATALAASFRNPRAYRNLIAQPF